MNIDLDQDAIVATADLVGRTGATQLQLGFLHEGVPMEEAGWYAQAQYKGARIIAEDHRGPVEAADALARQLLTGARCTHCQGLVALSDDGAYWVGGHMADGSTWSKEQARKAGQCRWRRMGPKWVRGCQQSASGGPKKKPKKKKR